jgi:hypothetical protein
LSLIIKNVKIVIYVVQENWEGRETGKIDRRFMNVGRRISIARGIVKGTIHSELALPKRYFPRVSIALVYSKCLGLHIISIALGIVKGKVSHN